jgi:DNA-binding IclR family transcriptional regulator
VRERRGVGAPQQRHLRCRYDRSLVLHRAVFMPSVRKSRKSLSPGYAANMAGVAAVDRALGIAEALVNAGAPLTLSQLADATGLYKSTVLRLMVSLERSTLAVRRLDQRYVPGPLAFRLGRAYEASNLVEACLLPLMKQLVERGMESQSFHVWQSDETRQCLLRVDSHHSTLDRVRAGDVLPLKRGAPGKVLRRWAPGSPGAGGVPSVETSFGERDPMCAAVAAPVFGPGGQLLGALSLSGPVDHFSEHAVRRMARPLLEAAEAATVALGGVWPAARARAPAVARAISARGARAGAIARAAR